MSSIGKVKGSAERLIHIPGYHIHPQFDLVHTRHLVEERRVQKKTFALSLAPMVDMFSILVIYLLMNFSTSGEIFFVSRDITIPNSRSGQPMESHPLISVLKGKIFFDAENPQGGKAYGVSENNDQQVPQLRAMLKKMRDIELKIGGEKNFRGKVNIQADVNTEIEEVKKVMRVLIEEGWLGINFIVNPETKK